MNSVATLPKVDALPNQRRRSVAGQRVNHAAKSPASHKIMHITADALGGKNGLVLGFQLAGLLGCGFASPDPLSATLVEPTPVMAAASPAT